MQKLISQVYELAKLFLIVFLVSIFLTFPASFPNPNPTRFVHLHKTNGGYGLVLDGMIISDVTIGGSAQLHGEIKRGDKIVSINGFVLGRNQGGIPELLETRDDDVKLVVVTNYEAPFIRRLISSMPFPLFIATACTVLLLLFTCFPGEERPESVREVTITTTNRCFGFTHLDNKIMQVTTGGPADLQGELKEGELITCINGVAVLNFRSETISQLCKTRDNELKLTVKSKSA